MGVYSLISLTDVAASCNRASKRFIQRYKVLGLVVEQIISNFHIVRLLDQENVWAHSSRPRVSIEIRSVISPSQFTSFKKVI